MSTPSVRRAESANGGMGPSGPERPPSSKRYSLLSDTIFPPAMRVCPTRRPTARLNPAVGHILSKPHDYIRGVLRLRVKVMLKQPMAISNKRIGIRKFEMETPIELGFG